MFDQSKYFSYNGGNRKGGMSLDHEVYVEAEVEMPAGVEEQIRRSGRESYIQETEINGFGVHVTVGKKKARLAFENLLRVRETRKAFYLFLSEQQAWILPKRQMEDAQEESEQLRTIFRTVVERKRLELKG